MIGACETRELQGDALDILVSSDTLARYYGSQRGSETIRLRALNDKPDEAEVIAGAELLDLLADFTRFANP